MRTSTQLRCDAGLINRTIGVGELADDEQLDAALGGVTRAFCAARSRSALAVIENVLPAVYREPVAESIGTRIMRQLS